MMLIDKSTFWRLPKYNGEMVLGLGENTSNQTQALESAHKINSVMSRNFARSWVFTDYGEQVVFDISNDDFLLTGEPYYYFWKFEGEDFGSNPISTKVIKVSRLTDKMKEETETIQNLNPAVYDVANKTMRFAAFFRYIKAHNRISWKRFLQQIRYVEIEPAIETPTKWNR